MNLKERNSLNDKLSPMGIETLGDENITLVAASPEFPAGVEFLILQPDGRFREGSQISQILEKYISTVPSVWINYPEPVKRILYAMDRLGFRLATFGGMEKFQQVYWIKTDGQGIDDSPLGSNDNVQLGLLFSQNGFPEKWYLA